MRRAEYFVDTVGTPGTGTPLPAADGQFDEHQENVLIQIDTVGWSDQRVIHVRAQDSAGNWGVLRSVSLTVQPDAPANWPTFGQNALIAVDLSAQRELWRVAGPSSVAPAVADGIVYALRGTKVSAYNSVTGAELWFYETGTPLVGAPLVTQTNLYIASTDHTWVLNRATHALIWEANKGGWLSIANDQLFIAQPDGKLTAYNLT